MFSLYTETPSFFNDICDEIRLFLPEEKHIDQLKSKEDMNAGNVLRHFFRLEQGNWYNRAELYLDGTLCAAREQRPDFTDGQGNVIDVLQDTLFAKKLKKHAVKTLIYDILREHFKKDMPWGSLTGIRPTKLLRELKREKDKDGARKAFLETYHVSKEKASLAETICKVQQPFLNVGENDLDVYIGIPFCVSRCKYCSFISRDLKFNETIKDQYLPCLFQEMDGMRERLKAYSIRAVYIGGGTPTALCEHDLIAVLEKTQELFPSPREFTVEAGRPDTVTDGKLRILREYGAQRISINAQTTKDETLALIGRQHTAEDFRKAYMRAQKIGFSSINTDVILGLPGETTADVEKTLHDVTEFEPENVTVHTLALKNSSEFALERQDDMPGAEEVSRMVELSQRFLMEQGYRPYYLYRQKYMSGNLENVGFSKPGKECVYNIDIMEETVSNLAFGAGAISKRLYPERNLIRRAPNVKDLKNYIDRTQEMIGRKKELF